MRKTMVWICRMGIGLGLCVSILFGNMLTIGAVSEEKATGAEYAETYFSDQFTAVGSLLSEEESSPMERELSLADYCAEMKVEMSHEGIAVKDGDRLQRDAQVSLKLSFSLQPDTVDGDSIFEYHVPGSIAVAQERDWSPAYDENGEHYMDWMCVDNAVKIRFTALPDETAGDTVQGFVNLSGSLSSAYISGGVVIYAFQIV